MIIDVSEGGVIRRPGYLPECRWEWDGDPELREITRIEVRYPDHFEDEYVVRGSIGKDGYLGLLSAVRIDGKKIKINPAAIIEMEDFTLASCRYIVNGVKRKEYLVLVDDGTEVVLKDRREEE